MRQHRPHKRAAKPRTKPSELTKVLTDKLAKMDQSLQDLNLRQSHAINQGTWVMNSMVTSPPELVAPSVDATPVIPESIRVREEVEDCAFIFTIAIAAISSKQSWLVIVAKSYPLAQHAFFSFRAWTKLLPHFWL